MTSNQFGTPAQGGGFQPEQKNTMGTVGFALSLVGLLLCGCLAPVSLVISLLGLRKEPRGFAVAGAIISALGILILIPASLMMAAVAIPAFIQARDTSRLNACQENQVRIDGAVQQYILDNNLPDDVTAIQYLNGGGGIVALVGTGNYLRVTPICPTGGTYSLVSGNPSQTIVCSDPKHPYPFSDYEDSSDMGSGGSYASLTEMMGYLDQTCRASGYTRVDVQMDKIIVVSTFASVFHVEGNDAGDVLKSSADFRCVTLEKTGKPPVTAWIFIWNEGSNAEDFWFAFDEESTVANNDRAKALGEQCTVFYDLNALVILSGPSKADQQLVAEEIFGQ